MKKLIGLLGLFALIAPSAFAGFPDVPVTHDYSSSINYVQQEGIVQGYEDGTYKPDNKINRAEFTKIIIGAKFTAEEIDSCVATKKFPDVPDNEWYAKYVCMAKNEEIISGYPDGTFKPTNEINFAEASKIVAKTYGLEVTPTEDLGYWYLPFVEALYLQAAVPATVTDFGKSITRGEMAEIIFGVETDQGYEYVDDVVDDTINDNTDDPATDDAAEVYSATEIRGFIDDCSKVMLKQSDMPAGYTIDSFEVYRGATTTDKYADCYQYINFPGMTSDQYPTTIHYLIAESEEVTHQQMEIIRNKNPNWGWEDQCQSYIGGKFSYYIEGGKGYFIDGSITEAEDEMNKLLYNKAWDLTAYYENAKNGSTCIGGRDDNPEFSDQSDENCLYLAEDIATGAADGIEVFVDNNGVLRENQCYLEVPESFVKARLATFGDANKAWDFFYNDYERNRFVFKTYTDQGFIYREDYRHGVIEEYDSRGL